MIAKQLRGEKDDACSAELSRLPERLLLLCLILTQTVGQEVGGEALGAVAHGCVVVCVSSKHQHGPAHYHRCVEVPEKATVP